MTMKKSKFREYLIITFGIILVALSIEYFYAPNNIAAGGVTGIAIIINAVIPSFSNRCSELYFKWIVIYSCTYIH